MKLTPTKVTLADGRKLIGGYKVALPKSECQKYGYDENTELIVKFTEKEIILTKKRGEKNKMQDSR